MILYADLVRQHGVLEACYMVHGFESRHAARMALWGRIVSLGVEQFYSRYQIVRKP